MSDPAEPDQSFEEMFAERTLNEDEVASINELVGDLEATEAAPPYEPLEDGFSPTTSMPDAGNGWSDAFEERLPGEVEALPDSPDGNPPGLTG